MLQARVSRHRASGGSKGVLVASPIDSLAAAVHAAATQGGLGPRRRELDGLRAVKERLVRGALTLSSMLVLLSVLPGSSRLWSIAHARTARAAPAPPSTLG